MRYFCSKKELGTEYEKLSFIVTDGKPDYQLLNLPDETLFAIYDEACAAADDDIGVYICTTTHEIEELFAKYSLAKKENAKTRISWYMGPQPKNGIWLAEGFHSIKARNIFGTPAQYISIHYQIRDGATPQKSSDSKLGIYGLEISELKTSDSQTVKRTHTME